MSSNDSALLQEIARLTGAINQHKSAPTWRPSTVPYPKPFRGRGHPPPAPSREVVIGGETFQASSRQLTRKPSAPIIAIKSVQGSILTMSSTATFPDLTASSSSSTSVLPAKSSAPGVIRTKAGNLVSGKPGAIKSRPLPRKHLRPGNLSLVLNGATRSVNSSGDLIHSLKSLNSPIPTKRRPKTERKQCRFFTRTGICTRGLTCRFKHDPNKTAICSRFLNHDCPNNASTCPLSHYPTAERVPVCVHFQNNGRCKNGDSCLYPHVRLGSKVTGICRDFAVLGYCEKGVDCDKGHVRECPDFADTGRCPTKGCKLPHVIRAKRTGPPPPVAPPTVSKPVESPNLPVVKATTDNSTVPQSFSGEEYISLTFHESDSDSGEEEDDDKMEDDDEDEEPDSLPEDMVMT